MKRIFSVLLLLLSGILVSGDVSIDRMTNMEPWTGLNGKTKPAVTENGLLFRGPGIIYRESFSDIPVDGSQDYDKQYQGIAFKVKGDGSQEWGAFGVITGPQMGGHVLFPLDNTEIQEYRVNFADMAPFGDYSASLNDTLRIGEIHGLEAGDRGTLGQNNYPRPQFHFEISDVRLIEKIEPKFVPGKFRPAPLNNVIEKMKGGKAVLILCFGDSITAGTSLQDRERDRYATVLQKMLRENYHNDQIIVRSVAVGGAHLWESISWLDRDLADGMPDAATMLIGYNNCSAGQSADMYATHLRTWIEKFAMKTGGKASVILIPTVPGVPRFFSQTHFAQATRDVAKEYQLPIAPIDAEIEKIGPQKYRAQYLEDTVHPNPAGHRLFAEILLQTFTQYEKELSWFDRHFIINL